MIDPSAIQSVKQLMSVWKLCVEDRKSGEVIDDVSLAIRWADNAFPFWNALVNTEVDADSESLVATMQEASDYMRRRSRPGFLWLFEDLLLNEARGSVAGAADSAGLSLALSGYGMAGDILPIEDPRHPDLEFVRVSDEVDVLAYGAINCEAYGFGSEALREGFSGSAIWTRDIFAYMALKDGRPISVAATVAADNCLFVILVATLPEFHRNGYGEAVTRKALYEGGKVTGLRRATLHATIAGVPVYERIGFKKVASIGFYGLKR